MLAVGRQRGRRGDRDQRRDGRRRTPPVRHGRRPVRARPPRRRAAPIGAQRLGPRRLRRSRRRAPGRGHTEMPFRHDARTVTVPGCVDGWIGAPRTVRHARRWRSCSTPAIRLAEDGFPASPLLVGALAALDDAARRAFGPLIDQAPGPGRASCAAGRRPDAAGRRRRRPRRLLRRRVRRGSARSRQRRPLRRRPRRGPSRLGRAARRRCVGPPAVDRAAQLPGLPHLAAAWIAERLDLPGRPRRPAWAHLLIEAATAAGYDRPAVALRGRRRRGTGRSRTPAPRLRPDRPPSRASRPLGARSRRRHHVPLHRRPRPDGCVADPVERVRVRQLAGRAGHRDQPPQPWARLLARSRPPGRARRRAAVRRTRCARRWSPSPTAPRTPCRHDGRRRPTADPAPAAHPSARPRPEPGGRDRRRPVGPVRPDRRVRHLDGARGPDVSVEGHAPDGWVADLAAARPSHRPTPPWDSGSATPTPSSSNPTACSPAPPTRGPGSARPPASGDRQAR